jgi:putative nucleotidyltransferase with HDIG domain
LQRLGGADAALRQRDVQHITVSSGRPVGPDERREFQVDPRDVYRAGLRVVDELYFQASRATPVDVKKASTIVSSLLDAMTQDHTALLGVAALKLYDEDTAHHSVNVAVLSLLIGQHLGLERGTLMPLGLAALLHDIGRVRLPQEALEPAGTPPEAERERLRRHTLYGAHLLRNLPGLSRLAMVVAFEHHANVNLSGYPEITAKTSTHLLTRIVGVADFYDAATASTHLDGPSMLPAEAVALIMDQAGRAFDLAVARALVAVVGRYPVGSVVELADGSLAVVVRPGVTDVDRPVVKIVADATRSPVVPRMLSLEEHPDVGIKGAADPAGAPVEVFAYLEA